MRMIVDICIAVPAVSSMWTVQRLRSCEDRSGLCLSLERQGRHVQLNAGTDVWGSRRPVDAWWASNTERRVLWRRCCHTCAYVVGWVLSDGGLGSLLEPDWSRATAWLFWHRHWHTADSNVHHVCRCQVIARRLVSVQPTLSRPHHVSCFFLTGFIFYRFCAIVHLFVFTACGSDGSIVFSVVVFSANMITREPLHLAWWNFA